MGLSEGRAKIFPPSSADDNSSFPNHTVIMMAPHQTSVQSVLTANNYPHQTSVQSVMTPNNQNTQIFEAPTPTNQKNTVENRSQNKSQVSINQGYKSNNS